MPRTKKQGLKKIRGYSPKPIKSNSSKVKPKPKAKSRGMVTRG